MARKKKTRWKKVWWEVRYQLACWSLKRLLFFSRLFPLRWAFFIMEEIGTRIGWRLAGKFKKKMLDNLTFTFKDSLSAEEKRRICKESLQHMIKGFVEFTYCVHFYQAKFDPKIEVEGKENLDKALTLGKGAIAVSAHLGNFLLLGAKFNASGFPFSIVIKEPDHSGLAQILRQARKKAGGRAIHLDPPLRCQKEILRFLGQGEIVCFVADQNQKRGGVLVEFLGRVMAMPVGPAIYHLRTGAPILPIFILRKGGDRHRVIIENPLGFELSGDEDRDVFTITDQVTRIIESYIRKYPGQWPWVSKRRIRTKTRRKTFQEEGAPSL